MPRCKEFWYNSWRSMMSRCFNPKAGNYKYYGGAGISVCDEWKDADTFGNWAKISGWFKGATIDRIDNQKGYCPENCKWSTKKEQAMNRRTTRYITHNSETHCITEWAAIMKIDRSILLNRLWRGWTEEEIFDTNKYKNQYSRRAKIES